MAKRTNKTNHRTRARVSSRVSNTSDKTSGADVSKPEGPSSGTGDKDKASDEIVEESKSKGKNDPVWYSRYPQLLADASRLTFAEPFGPHPVLYKGNLHFPVGDTNVPNMAKLLLNKPEYAGIATYKVRSCIGNSMDRNDPANVAASMLYTHVRYVNSGRKNYDPSDLMMYVLAIADLYSFIAWLKKIYALAFMYSAKNMFIGKACIEAMGIDADDIVNNLANFRYFINACINKVTSWAIPSDLPYFNLKMQMYSGLYTESMWGNLKDQMYQVAPDAFYQFKLDSSGLGQLELLGLPTGTITFSDLSGYFNQLISNIWGDEDFGLMSGDVLKAFEGRIIGIEPQGDEAAIIPVPDVAMLEKLRNARVMRSMEIPIYGHSDEREVYEFTIGEISNYRNMTIRQDTKGNLVCKVLVMTFDENDENAAQNIPLYHMNTMNYYNDPLVNVDPAETSPELVIEATRFTPVARLSDSEVFHGHNDRGENIVAHSFSTGTEVVSDIIITVGDINNQGGGMFHHFSHWDDWAWISASGTIDGYDAHAPMNAWWDSLGFKYLPMMYLYYGGAVNGDYANGWSLTHTVFLKSLENWTRTDAKIIERMHEVALLSLLSVPGVAHMIIDSTGK